MSYFKNFNYIKYDFTIKTDVAPVVETFVDIMGRVDLKISKDSLEKLCDQYVVPSGIKPEQISATLYNDPTLHWTILYINDISNIYSEWPITESNLSEFVTKKYGSGNEYATHHYEKYPERLWIDPQFCLDTYGEEAVLISNYEYEYELNELKRHILVIKPDYIGAFVSSFEKAFING